MKAFSIFHKSNIKILLKWFTNKCFKDSKQKIKKKKKEKKRWNSHSPKMRIMLWIPLIDLFITKQRNAWNHEILLKIKLLIIFLIKKDS